MWISGGEHELADNIVHLVLAKIPGAPAGVRGISLFAVPRRLIAADATLGERNDVALAGLNHKMGYRGTVNTLLSFGEGRFRPEGRAGAIGYLVGEPHQGLACMFHMMNEARIGVGLGAVALGYAGYLESLDYARNRPQGRPPDARDPAAATGCDRRARRRAPHAARAEGVRRGRPRAQPLLRACSSTSATPRPTQRPGAERGCCSIC